MLYEMLAKTVGVSALKTSGFALQWSHILFKCIRDPEEKLGEI